MFDWQLIRERQEAVQERIALAAARAGRAADEVTLIAVTKTWPAELVLAAYEAGLRHFGENRAEELIAKRPLVAAMEPAPPVPIPIPVSWPGSTTGSTTRTLQPSAGAPRSPRSSEAPEMRGVWRSPRDPRRRGSDFQSAARRRDAEGRAWAALVDHRQSRHDALRGGRGGKPRSPGGRSGRQYHRRRDIRRQPW